MPAVVLSKMVESSRSSSWLRRSLWCCSVMSRVTTAVLRFPEDSVEGSTRVSNQRGPNSGWLMAYRTSVRCPERSAR